MFYHCRRNRKLHRGECDLGRDAPYDGRYAPHHHGSGNDSQLPSAGNSLSLGADDYSAAASVAETWRCTDLPGVKLLIYVQRQWNAHFECRRAHPEWHPLEYTVGWLNGATPASNPFCSSNGTVWTCQLVEANGQPAELVWDSQYGAGGTAYRSSCITAPDLTICESYKLRGAFPAGRQVLLAFTPARILQGRPGFRLRGRYPRFCRSDCRGIGCCNLEHRFRWLCT